MLTRGVCYAPETLHVNIPINAETGDKERAVHKILDLFYHLLWILDIIK